MKTCFLFFIHLFNFKLTVYFLVQNTRKKIDISEEKKIDNNKGKRLMAVYEETCEDEKFLFGLEYFLVLLPSRNEKFNEN